MDTIPFKCPSCGVNGRLRVASEPKTYDDLLDATCDGCGYAITDDDIKQQGRAIIDKLVKDAFKRGGA